MPESRDARVDAYIAAQAEFARPILSWCRDRLHAACPGVSETIKWGRPFFLYHGKTLAGLGAFKAHMAFSFWHDELEKTGGEGEAMGQFGRIMSLDDLPDAAAMEARISAAAALIDAGVKPARMSRDKAAKPEAEVPEALAQALAQDAQAAATFAAFPPGARRDYCEWIGEAKRPETRDRRVAEAVGWLREGKKRNWKYARC